MKYIPSNLVNKTPEEIVEWATKEFDNIARAFAESDFLIFKKLHEQPKRIVEGLIVFADGSDWNPGSGAGLYIYRVVPPATVLAWHYLG